SRQGALDGGLALTDLPHGREARTLVLGDAGGCDLSQRGVLSEVLLQMTEDADVLEERSLPRLGSQVALGRLGQRQSARLRLRLLHLKQASGERLLGILAGPLSLVDSFLLAVHLHGVAPGLALRALAGDLPGSLVNLGQGQFSFPVRTGSLLALF